MSAQIIKQGLPGIVPAVKISGHPLILGASPGTTGTMSLYYALVMLNVSSVHYSRQYHAPNGTEWTSYEEGGGPVPLLKPLFAASGTPPPVDLAAIKTTDMRFLEGTEALLDTPAMEVFFEALVTFPSAKIILTSREPRQWAVTRRARHPTDRAPLFHNLGIDAPVGALSEDQAAMAFALWQRTVIGSVPAERLLVLDLFSMADEVLWKRLCTFIGKPLPVDEKGKLPPFPHQHYAEDVNGEAPKTAV